MRPEQMTGYGLAQELRRVRTYMPEVMAEAATRLERQDTTARTLVSERNELWYPSREAAAELRRLDAREAELLALLRQANELLIDNRDDVERIESARYMRVCYDPVLVAIKAATGETK